MEPDHATRAAMERLEPFIGEWVMEATFPSGPADATGRAVFEWALGRQFLIERSEVPGAPDSIAITGFDSGRQSFCQHYFDSRGVARVYAMDFSGGVWTLLRETPDFTPLAFAQRFTGTFSADGQRIDGRWERSEGGPDWALDFHLSFTKIS
jgi:hypothetical protein